MMRKIIISAVLLALLFPQLVRGHHTCKPPEKMDGEDSRHQQQIELAKQHDLPFFETATSIRRIVEGGEWQLAHVPNEGVGFKVRGIGINPVSEKPLPGCKHYPESVRAWLYYVQPGTLAYLELLAHDFEGAFPERFIEVTGLSRTEEGQKLLRACYATSKLYSPHQWGITFDVAWKRLSNTERCWLLERLGADQDSEYIVVVDEVTYGKHLHVTVRPNWLERRVVEMYPITALIGPQSHH